MKKRLFALILTIVVLFAIAIPSFAEYSYDYLTSVYGESVKPNYDHVYDLAGVLNDTERYDLSSYIKSEALHYGVEIDVLTYTNACNHSTQTFIDDFYDYYIDAATITSGVLIAIDFDNRQVYINTVGTAISEISDREIDDILDSTSSYASDGEYYAFFKNTVASTMMAYGGESIGQHSTFSGSWTDKLIPSGDSLIISTALTCAVIGIIVAVHNKNNRAPSASNYMEGGMSVKSRSSIPMGVRTEVIHDFYKQQSSSGGGGSSHMSGGGVSHGGGGHGF